MIILSPKKMKQDYNSYNKKQSTITKKPKIRIILLIITTFTLGYIFASYSNHPITPTDHFRFSLPQCGTTVAHNNVRSKILTAFYDSVSPFEYFPPAHLAHLLTTKTIHGWDSNATIFETLIKKIRPKTIIEIGTFLGASASHMANVTRELELDTQILCISDFRGWAAFRDVFKSFPIQNGNVMLLAQFMQNMVTLNMSETVIPIPFSTMSGLDRLCEMGVVADLIEVDSGRDFHSTWDDINRAYKLLRPGGVIFGHDYFNGNDDYGVRRAVDLFAKFYGFKVVISDKHWIIDDVSS